MLMESGHILCQALLMLEFHDGTMLIVCMMCYSFQSWIKCYAGSHVTLS